MQRQTRQQSLLRAIIEEYIRSARPVSSKTLVDDYGWSVSPATIRNDMAALEQAGFIMQPHTSAGRVPTEAGYQYYIQHFININPVQTNSPNLDARRRRRLSDAMDLGDRERETEDPYQRLKQAARTIAEVADEAVIVASPDDSYYTGLSHAVRKPDFSVPSSLLALTDMLERLDELMVDVDSMQTRQPYQIFIGHDNPWFAGGAVVLARYELPTAGGVRQGVIGIVGPMRMDYATNVAVLSYVEQLMHSRDDTS